MSHPDPLFDPVNSLPEDVEREEPSPAELWENIVDLTKTIQKQVADLRLQLEDLNKSAL